MLKRLKASKKQKALREETSDFLTAAQNGDLEAVSEFIRNNFDINASSENGLSALHLAAKEGHTEVIKELLKHGADINSATKKGNVALHMACASGQLEAAKVLMENGADANAQSESGFSALYIAAQENHQDLVKFLLSHGADPSLKTADFFLPLDIAIQQLNGRVVECLLENDPTNRVALPALHVAAKNNDIRATKFLLADGYDVSKLSPSGFTALHIGSRYGNLEVCQLLIEKGADVNFKAKNDISPLHVCSKEGHSAIVDLLLSRGADPNRQTAEGLTALHCAAVSGHDQAVDSLVRNGASLSLKTKNGLTPLHVALQANQASCTRQLLQYNAPIDDFSEDNLTPLHVAAHCGNLKSAQILLEAGCDVNAKAKNGFSPLHVACKRNHKEMVELLLKYEADVNKTSDTGILPVHVAAFMGHVDILTTLIQRGTSLDGSTTRGMTPVYLATLANKTDAIELLLQKGAIVDAATTEQRTPLHVASELGNSDDVIHLLQHGASPHAKTLENFLPLNFATRTGNQEVVQLLLEYGAPKGKGSFQKAPSNSSALKEFSTVRDDMRYIKDENDGIEAPVLKWKPLEGFSSTSPSRSKPFDRDSRLSHTQSSIVLPGLPSLSFWSSFLTDARGGEMIGCRHSGIRIILPPSKIPNPMGIKCKLIRKEKLRHPPPLKEGEGLACRALETSPAGSKFIGPVIFEIPHFASLRDREREIVILRSDNGRSWNEHFPPSLDDMEPTLKNTLLSEMMQSDSSLIHIITVDLPRFFALISRIPLKQELLSAEEGSVSSILTPKVKVSFPPESFRRKTKVGLQAQSVSPDAVLRALGEDSFASPIVTVEPQRRKFHLPVSMTIPLPSDEARAEDTRLLCSITGGNNQAVWEDITSLTPLTAAGDLVSFTTSVSGKYWLLSSPSLSDVQKLYLMTIPVPYLSKFVVFAKRLSRDEGRLRVFCMTDDKVDKTLERQEQFVEVARSEDVEVLEGIPQYIHLDGNLLPMNVTPGDQLHLNFHAFRENRLPLTVRVVDPGTEASGYMTFMKYPGTRDPQSEICVLKVTLPMFDDGRNSEKIPFTPLFRTEKSDGKTGEPELLKAELRLSDVAESIGENWKQVAERLGIPQADIDLIQSEYDDPIDQAFMVLQQWMDENGSRANGNSLEEALRDLGMDDIIASCMCNVADVTDVEEKTAARSYLDAGVHPLKVEMGSSKDLGSSGAETIRHSLSPDDAYSDIELRKAGLLLPGEGEQVDTSDENDDMFRRSRAGEKFPFIDRSISTMSTNTITTLPSDVETFYQSMEEIHDGDQTIVKAEIHEEETQLEDGSSLVRKVVTVRHFRHWKGSEEQLTRIEMDEENLLLPPGVKLPLEEDVDDILLETSIENSEETLENGVLLFRKVTSTKAIKMLPGKQDDTDHLPAQDLTAEEDSSLASPSSENLLSNLGAPDVAELELSGTSRSEEGVPVVEEELVEERIRATYRPLSRTVPDYAELELSGTSRSEGVPVVEEELVEERLRATYRPLSRTVPDYAGLELSGTSRSEEGVPVVEEELVEERIRATYRPLSRTAPRQDESDSLAEGGSLKGVDESDGIHGISIDRQPSSEISVCGASESNRRIKIPSNDLSAGESRSATEFPSEYLDSVPQNGFLLDGFPTEHLSEERQSDLDFTHEHFDSAAQHEALSDEPTFLAPDSEVVCLDSVLHEEVILKDVELEYPKRSLLESISTHLESNQQDFSLQDSSSKHTNEKGLCFTEFGYKYMESETRDELISENPALEYSKEASLMTTDLKYLETGTHTEDSSQELESKEGADITEAAREYFKLGSQHEDLLERTASGYPGDSSQHISESDYKNLQPEVLHPCVVDSTTSVHSSNLDFTYEHFDSAPQSGVLSNKTFWNHNEGILKDIELEYPKRNQSPSISTHLESNQQDFSLQDSPSKHTDEKGLCFTEFGYKYMELEPRDELILENSTLEYSKETSLTRTDLRYLGTGPHAEDSSQELKSELELDTTKTACEYFKLGSQNEDLLERTASRYKGDSSQRISESGYEHLEPEVLHTHIIDSMASEHSREARIDATESDNRYLEPEAGFENISENLASNDPSEQMPCFTQLISNKVESFESSKFDRSHTAAAKLSNLFASNSESQQLTDSIFEDDLPLIPTKEGNSDVNTREFIEDWMQKLHESSTVEHNHAWEKNAYKDDCLNDRVSGRSILEDETETDSETLKHARVVLRRRVHKKTMITAGCQEETVVTEDTHVEQDSEAPKELSFAIQQIIEQFVHGESAFVTTYNAC